MQRHNRWQSWPPEDEARLVELYRAGKTHAKIAVEIGLSDSVVGHKLNELGLRRRLSHKGAPKIEAVTIRPLSTQPPHVQMWVRERTRPMPSGLPVVPPAVIDDCGRRLG